MEKAPIMKGAEPFSFKSNSDIGILAVHGISGSPHELSYVCGRFAEASYNVECPLLKGHGTVWQDIPGCTYQDWVNDIETALSNLKARSSRIFVIGLSMGGALTLYLAENHPELKGIIVINNPYRFKGLIFKLIPILKYFIPFQKKRRPGNKSRSIKDKSARLVNYDRIPISGLDQLLKLLKEVRKNIGKIQVPVLLFKSLDDSLPVYHSELLYQAITTRSKELIKLTNSYHLATLDFDKELIAQNCLQFIQELSHK